MEKITNPVDFSIPHFRLRQSVNEGSRGAVIAQHFIVEIAHDIEIAVRSECEAARVRKAAAAHAASKDANKSPLCAVVLQNSAAAGYIT